MNDLKYPIGKFLPKEHYDQKELITFIKDIENFPASVSKEISTLEKDELNWRYRPEGWSIRQVIHHCADSHLNSVIRFKLALTENNPTIKPYLEDKWAELADINAPVELSLDLLKPLHSKWVVLLKSLKETDLQKTYTHPQHGKIFNLAFTIALYAWHGNHHLAHIKQAKRLKIK